MAIASFIGIFFLNIPFPYIILGAIVIGWLAKRFYPAIFKEDKAANKVSENESQYYLNMDSPVPGTGFNAVRLTKQLLVIGALWLIPFLLFNNS